MEAGGESVTREVIVVLTSSSLLILQLHCTGSGFYFTYPAPFLHEGGART